LPDLSRGTLLFVEGAGQHHEHVDALRVAGYRVHVAASALAALETRDTARPDALIVPLLLPDMTGTALARSFRHDGGRPVVLILTPQGASMTAREGPMEAGATLCDVPCAPGDLVATIERLLGHRH
jgi:two-component system, OmpR family, response regulator